MQAILTKYHGATNTRSSRVSARCERGSITISWDHGFGSGNGNHIAAAKALVEKFLAEDTKRHGPDSLKTNPWARPFVTGSLKDAYCHVFLERL